MNFYEAALKEKIDIFTERTQDWVHSHIWL